MFYLKCNSFCTNYVSTILYVCRLEINTIVLIFPNAVFRMSFSNKDNYKKI